MPTKLGNGGHSQEAYDSNTGKYTDQGNISNDEEKEAMKYFALNSEYDQPKKMIGKEFPWKWKDLAIEDFNIRGYSRIHLDNLIYEYKSFMDNIEKRINGVGNWFYLPTKEEMEKYNAIKSKFEKYLPYYNKEKNNPKENISHGNLESPKTSQKEIGNNLKEQLTQILQGVRNGFYK